MIKVPFDSYILISSIVVYRSQNLTLLPRKCLSEGYNSKKTLLAVGYGHFFLNTTETINFILNNGCSVVSGLYLWHIPGICRCRVGTVRAGLRLFVYRKNYVVGT